MLDPNNMNLELRDYLIKNNALTKFLNNCIKRNTNLTIDTCIGNAFIWSETPEGETYWADLDTAWDMRNTCLPL